MRATAAVPCSRRCIITARADETGRVSQGKLQQVVSQLHRAQPELLEFFELPSDESCHRIVELVPGEASEVASENRVRRWRDVPRATWGPGMYATLQGDGRPILVGGAVYAAGYSKSLALLRACIAESVAVPTHIFFVDDAPNNAYEVHRDLPGWLREWSADEASRGARQDLAAEPVVGSLWWDLHEEEFESKSIATTTSGADFAYLRDGADQGFLYSSALRHFGLSESDIVERAEKYERVRREHEARQAAKVAALDISDANVEAPSTSQPSVLDRRHQVHELLVAHGRAPAD